MSKLIASAAIRGAHKIVNRAEKSWNEALKKYGPDQKVEFPNTGYYLPVIFAMTGIEVKTLKDCQPVIEECKRLLPPVPDKQHWLPFLGVTLDAGMATLWADEIIEALKYIKDCPYAIQENCPEEGNFWLGAADDVIMRKRGIEFVDGTAPGFAACVGAAPTVEQAVKLARELQEKNLYVFMSADTHGKTMADQLRQAKVQMGWETRLVPFGKDVTSTVFALGFAARAAMAFGGVKPGDYKRTLLYNKNRIFAFALALGEIDDEKYAQAAGAINYGFPAIADTDIPEILPTGVCTYEHVVSRVKVEDMVSKAVEVRGLKIQIHKVPIPVSFGPAFEGERIRKEDMQVEFGGSKTSAFEVVFTKDLNQVEDNKIEVIGPEIDDMKEGGAYPLGIVVDVAGRQMSSDYEPIFERWVHTFLNEASGIFHMGQRDINMVRINKEAKQKGFKIKHLGTILHAKFHADFGAIVDKVQVRIYTNEKDVLAWRDKARATYKTRDERLGSMTDESVEMFYSCALCQSFAPTHICVVTPERSGLCGSYNWLDCKAAFQMNPTGPNQPVPKVDVLDPAKGVWKSVNDFVYASSRKSIEKACAYSIMDSPMTSCGCFECISAILPLANGIMTVNREFADMTPCGMKFSTLAGTVGGGLQVPGFVGHSRIYIGSKKFLLAEGGLARLTWAPKALKEAIKPYIEKRGKEMGIPDLYDKIADETIATTEEEVLAHMQKTNHPALTMPSLIG